MKSPDSLLKEFEPIQVIYVPEKIKWLAHSRIHTQVKAFGDTALEALCELQFFLYTKKREEESLVSEVVPEVRR